MLTSAIVRLVKFCVRHARAVVAAFLLVTVLCGLYAAAHMKINSDINALLSPDLGWRKSEQAFEKAFHHFDTLYAVVDAPTPELAAQATAALTTKLAADNTHFISVTNIAGLPFFSRAGLLFMPLPDLERTTKGLAQGAPLIQDLASDPSLRGMVSALEDGLIGVNSKKMTLDDMSPVFNASAQTVEDILAGRPASFSWRVLAQGQPATPSELRGVIAVRPVLDFKEVQAGLKASTALRDAAAELLPRYQARLRLTGPVAMSDEEFGTIKENAGRNGAITAAIVLFILWRALRSWRLIGAVVLNIVAGLAITAAAGLALVGSLNLISVYFFVLFVGIGVDFGIQFSVRYRAERHEFDNLHEAIARAAYHFGVPLTLAGFATACGFLAFAPTDFKGVSELGIIAGLGMIIAFAVSITLLPSLIALFNPAGEPEPMGYKALAPVDEFMSRNRKPIIAGVALVVGAGLPLLFHLRFDFNPIHLRDPNTESVATYLDLKRDRNMEIDNIQLLAPNTAEAEKKAERLAQVPEVAAVRTLMDMVPAQQDEKLALIAKTAAALKDALNPDDIQPPPTDAEIVESLKEAAQRLEESANDSFNAGQQKGIAGARRLAAALTGLAQAPAEKRLVADEVMVGPLVYDLEQFRDLLTAQKVTLADLPPELVKEWRTPDGQQRLSIAPKDQSGSEESLRAFARAVLKVEPNATEGPVSILEASRTIIGAFFEAAGWALASIALLLIIMLRRVSDMLLTLIPLMLAAVVTMEVMVLLGMPLNFANIIALPLLLGVGVAFKIYYIMAWREGGTNLLQTSLTRAVMFSAATTATAFGSLYFSSHPGTSSMGELLALSLVCTLAAAVLFQPILMGKPREKQEASS
ncbi:hopanoid biosynthesis associated RND transporter like protein HpnN [Rhodoblastus acidophilus]|uniref:hopanoid transporter HpnN n=1 Tax=Rhodoblastus acidophilus TaxID=1074 RepID=UPI0022257758|nr:MMPL family transporter [Rhodoblastus acidophilus]MCW2284500.1 hopanoid biosynthesis associated RND transporter like protein HpnN [Rhodoblastus acidophilus]MCW2333347.1 hopanoid biosynthesis associated RND transporter like protein HpnN [Rhodoblastus acidophilus]